MSTSLFGNKISTPGFPASGSTSITPSTGLFQTSNSLFGQSTSTPSSFAFGSSATTAPSSSFSFSQPTGFGTNQKPAFGASTATTPAFNSFTTSAPAFGGFTTTTPAFSSFTSTTPAFGSFTTTTPAFSSFSTTGFGSAANANPALTTVQTTISEDELFIDSISQPSLCGDERDVIISRWNQLQAMWGHGCGLTCKGKAMYNSDNYLARFKSISYNQVPNCDDSDGYVSLLIKRAFTTVVDEKIQIHEKLHQLINNQSVNISIVDIRPAIKAFAIPTLINQPKLGFGQPQITNMPSQTSSTVPVDSLCDVFVKVTENMPNGPPRLVASSTLANFLKSEPLKSKLETELSVLDVVPQSCPNTKEINDYLTGPAPRGLDVELWERAKQQCPNLNSLVPVPVVGMSELKARINGQVQFAQSQLATIRKESEVASEMKTKVITMSGKIDQIKRNQMELSNRILKVMCRLEIIKKQGYSLSGDEEALKCSLDKLWNQLVGPYGIKSRLQEILSTPNNASSVLSSAFGTGKFSAKLSTNHINNESIEELKEYFSERQQSIKEMMTLIREDMACLNIIENSTI